MRFNRAFARTVSRLRGLFAPHYHPERHYMRGPGPAFAERAQRTVSDGEIRVGQKKPQSPLNFGH